MAFDFKPKSFSTQSSVVPRVREIYLGIDFGTTFTKVSFQIGDREGTTKYSLKFQAEGDEEDYCLPSLLGYNAESCSLVFTQEPEDDGVEEIKYFKYSMIERGVPRNKSVDGQPTANDPQRLCSAFYIAHVLKMTKREVLKHRVMKDVAGDVRWYVNMGVPVSDFNARPKPIYDEALNVAWNLSESTILDEEMGLRELDEFYSRWIDHKTWSSRLNTVPELYAELIMFLQDRTVDTGFYSVIDIGGGTVDMAVFFKRIGMYDGNVEISCVAQDVCPLGYEIYKNVLVDQSVRGRMKAAYGGLVDVAYHCYRHEMEKARNSGIRFVHFFMGGARSVEFYRLCVDEMISVHRGAWLCYPGAEFGDMVEFMKGKYFLDVDDNPRVLISQMLAQPFERMPELVGQPWHFNANPVPVNAPSLEELQDSIYGPN